MERPSDPGGGGPLGGDRRHPARGLSAPPRGAGGGAARPARSLARAGLLVAANAGANLSLFLAALLASRSLGPDEFGAVGAMLGLVVVLSIPAFSVTAVVAREVAAGGDAAAAARRRRLDQAAALGLATTLLGLAVAPALAAALDVGTGLVVVTALSGLPILLLGAMRGVLQGGRRYEALGVSFAAEGVARLGAVGCAVALGGGALAITAAPAAAAGAALALTAGLLGRSGLPRPRRRLRDLVPEPGLWGTGAFFAGFAALSGIDVVVAKHTLGGTEAGEYAAASLFGKIVLFLGAAVSLILLPESAARSAAGRSPRRMLVLALAATGGLGGLVVAAGFIAPGAIRTVMFGGDYAGVDEVLGPYGLAALALALGYTCGTYLISLGAERFGWILLAGAPVQLTGLLLLGGSVAGLVSVLGATGVLLVSLMLALTPAAERRHPWAASGALAPTAGAEQAEGTP